MNKNCYQIVNLQNQSLLQKMFNQFPEENSIIELNNLLASTEIQFISQQDIISLSKKYKINILQEYKKNIIEFYIAYVYFAVSDNKITDEEFDNINHLKEIFNINQAMAIQINNDIVSQIYKTNFEKALSDGKIDETEKNFLSKLQTELRLETKIVSDISSNLTKEFFETFTKRLLKNERISPEDDDKLNAILKNLQIQIPKETQIQIDKFKHLWKIENEELQEISTELKLSKAEKCFFNSNAEWYESKGNKQSIEFNSNTTRKIDISRWNFVTSGNLFFSNKRILMTTATGNKIVNFEKVISIVSYLDGVQIAKDAGKDVFIKTDRDSKEVAIVLNKLLNNRTE